MIEYRPALSDDVDELRAVAIKTWVDTFGDRYSKSVVDNVISNTRSEEYIRQSVERFITLLAVDIQSNRIVGYLQITTLDKIIHELFETLESDRQIDRLYLLKEFQKQKIGSTLMTMALNHEYLNDCTNLYIEVDKTSPNVQKLYESFGFVKTGKENPFIENGVQVGADNILIKKL
ncbi:MAG: GNAT family N-acetyltransferase [Acidimicrobiia bacterium]|nr:GNAT family N-acetyltransferase [Acidimicrobiia bacterium]